MIKETTDQNTMTDIGANYFNNPRRLANDKSMRQSLEGSQASR